MPKVKTKKITIADVSMDGFESSGPFESMADFIPQDILEDRFIMYRKTVELLMNDECTTENDARFLAEVLSSKAFLYVFTY